MSISEPSSQSPPRRHRGGPKEHSNSSTTSSAPPRTTTRPNCGKLCPTPSHARSLAARGRSRACRTSGAPSRLLPGLFPAISLGLDEHGYRPSVVHTSSPQPHDSPRSVMPPVPSRWRGSTSPSVRLRPWGAGPIFAKSERIANRTPCAFSDFIPLTCAPSSILSGPRYGSGVFDETGRTASGTITVSVQFCGRGFSRRRRRKPVSDMGRSQPASLGRPRKWGPSAQEQRVSPARV